MINEKSIIDALEKRQATREKEQEIIIERIEDYKAALNNIFSSPDGKLFAKYLLKYCGIFSESDNPDTVRMVADKGKRLVYLKMIRPYLEKKVRQQIEHL